MMNSGTCPYCKKSFVANKMVHHKEKCKLVHDFSEWLAINFSGEYGASLKSDFATFEMFCNEKYDMPNFVEIKEKWDIYKKSLTR